MSQSENIGWIVELTIKDGKFKLFEELSREMMASTKNEIGTLQYEWNMLDDNKTVIIIERYKNSVAALIHTTTFAEKFAARFDEVAFHTRLLVYGVPDMKLRQVLSDAGGIFSKPI
jgi:quinol monooxygenase YgiN